MKVTHVSHVSLYVRDQQEALQWYSEKLGFRKATDMPMSETARWITMTLPDHPELEIVLEAESMADGPAMAADVRSRVGKSSMMVLEVTGIYDLVAELKAKGVAFEMDPMVFPYGTQAIMVDLYGNKFVLSQAPEGGYPTGN